jgi:ribosomal protein L11 methyltransferase
MNNPFAQSAQYFEMTCELPKAAAEHADLYFEDVAVSVSAFEVDEAKGVWKLTVLYGEAPDTKDVERRLALMGAVPPYAIEPREPKDWVASIAQDFPPLRVGRFFVHGSHITDAPPVGSLPLQIEAGAAFGSGEHGTTSTCLQALAWLAQRREMRKVLDMGTGSGILAIAAAKLWNAEILAVDLDPVAVRVAAQNVVINQAQGSIRCAVSNGYKSAHVKRFGTCDLIIANILARPLISFAPYLAKSLAAGGYCVLSGLLENQARMVLSAHRSQGLRLEKSFYSAGWCTLVLSHAYES